MGHKELLSALVQVVEINSGIDGIYMCCSSALLRLFTLYERVYEGLYEGVA